MIHHRWMPAIESDGTDSLDELVTMSGYDAEVGRAFAGDFELSLFDSPVEELDRLQPQRTDRRVLARGRRVVAGRHHTRATHRSRVG